MSLMKLLFRSNAKFTMCDKTGTEQSVNLVINTVKAAMKKEKVTGLLQLHSDQGAQ